MKRYSFQNALVAAYSDTTSSWRYSLITTNLSLGDKGKVLKEFSNPRRFSFLLGPGQKVLTPFKQLLQAGEVTDIEPLTKRFSLEVVNNEFYREIARLYDDLIGTDKNARKLKYPNSGDESHEFAVRLIGRIIFCWFLREKKSSAELPLVPDKILSRNAAEHQNYYHCVLAPLFFEVLNKPIEKRTAKFQVNEYKDIPYLNGGLFSNDSIDYYKFDKVIETSIAGLVDIPDAWLRELFDLLERFNFTVDENTSYDTDLSIDPEMLGRVFENLLARINPETGETVRNATGSFYTPREIVEYMVDTSLSEYLHSKTDITKQKSDALVSYDLFDDVGNALSEVERIKVLEALSTLTVLDPACGSGAFPIGMLQKIVFVISRLDPENEWWKAKQLEGASPELRREFDNRSVDYVRKLGIIRQTIFGVDIQPIATEISRLRCFLTLIVDEAVNDSEKNRGIRPLPNLEFKFITANTLVKPPKANRTHNMSMFDDFGSQLSEKVKEYFSAQQEEKIALLNSIRDLIDAKVDENTKYVLNNAGLIKDERFVDEFNKKNSQMHLALINEANTWKSYNNVFKHKAVDFYATEYFFPSVPEGFDIIIGNPPYIQLQKDGGNLGKLYEHQDYKTYARMGDIYSLFYERGLELTKPKSGLLCYITSNKWMRAGYGESLRHYFTTKQPIQLLDFGGFRVFDSATVDTNILLIRNNKAVLELAACHFHSDYQRGNNLADYFQCNKVMLTDLSEEMWFIGSQSELDLKAKIEKIGTPLKDWDVKINYGIKTGLNEAFIVDQQKRDELITADPKSAEIFKPIFRGRDIKRYSQKWVGLYLLFIPWHFPLHKDSSITGPSDEAEAAFQEQYPAIYAHLLGFKEKLLNRNKSEVGIRYEWFALQRCAASYYEDFENESVVWPETMRVHRTGNPDFPRFSIKPAGYYLDKTTFMMNIARPKYFLGFINSKLGWKIIDTYVDKLDQGGYMMQKSMVENIPIPDPDNFPELVSQIESLVSEVNKLSEIGENTVTPENMIDQIIYKLYNLDPQEIQIIESGK